MHRWKTALYALGAATAVVLAAWMVDTGLHRGEALRNVEIGGIPVGGKDAAQIGSAIDRLRDGLGTRTLRVTAPDGGFSAKGGEIGLALDDEATVAAAMGAGRSGAIPGRILSWALSPMRHRHASPRVTLDRDKLSDIIDERDTGPRVPAREPTILGVKGEVQVQHGEDGRGIDPAAVLAAVRSGSWRGTQISVEVERGTVSPRHSVEEARALAREAERLTDGGISVSAGGATAQISTSTLRGWVTSRPEGDALVLALDPEKTEAGLAKALPDVGETPKETEFKVVSGEVQIIAGKTGTRCCGAAAVTSVEKAVRDGQESVRGLALEVVEPTFDPEEARKLQIKEAIGSFTTRYPAGQPRVVNIHKIADIMRGKVIKPGQTISINDAVGKRTTARGFVDGGVIEDGKFAEAVGGGISQFATTMFNASFFAGLDLVEYQSHSIYISRYPYGREATLNFPKPDLRIRNSTPYGVLIWPTYTGTSITVTLYSTKFAEGAQTGQTTAPSGSCTRVRTQRTRTYVKGGEKKVDYVSALYRAQEGLNCNQQPTTSTSSTASTTSTTADDGPSTTTSSSTSTTRPPSSSTTTTRP